MYVFVNIYLSLKNLRSYPGIVPGTGDRKCIQFEMNGRKYGLKVINGTKPVFEEVSKKQPELGLVFSGAA